MKKAIAMRCTEEQYEKIKPKLLKAGLKIESLQSFKNNDYLVNNLESDFGLISNVYESRKEFYGRQVVETWNEKLFLEACGIKTEPDYVITKEQILLLHKDAENDTPQLVSSDLKSWFPEGSLCNYFHLYGLNVIPWNDNFMDSVKTITLL